MTHPLHPLYRWDISGLDHFPRKIDWLKTGQMPLDEQMSGEQEIVTLAKNIISFLTTYLRRRLGYFIY